MAPVELPVIGFIGLGAIGRPIAERIVAAGYRLIAHDINSAALASFANIERADHAAEVADKADIVFTCLTTPESHRKALWGPSGVVAGRRARYCVHLGATGAQLVGEIVKQLAPAGISVIDAPMTGGVPAARSGTLTVMVSGQEDAFRAVEPVLQTYAGNITYFGSSPGMAQTMKIVNNMIALANLVIATEAVGVKAGLSPDDMLEVLNGGSARSAVTADKLPHYILPRKFDFGGTLGVVLKDVELFLDEADKLGLTTPLGAAVRDAYKRAIEQGSASDDLTTVIRVSEKAAGVEFRKGNVPLFVENRSASVPGF